MDSEYEKLSVKTLNLLNAENSQRQQKDFKSKQKEELQFLGLTKDTDLVSATYTNDSTAKFDSESGANNGRDTWGKDIEFLLSCIALSVGLGNIWRFPVIALENGGGAFVVPYVIVLMVIGRPVYYLEVIIGQFSSRGCIQSFDMAPIMKGVAYGQVYATGLATTYYASIMALTLRYLYASLSDVLPWTQCDPAWGDGCVATAEVGFANSTNASTKYTSSAELFFTKSILREYDNLDEGIGPLNIELVVCLLITWIFIATTLIKGIHSSGKASYFLALFPYAILLILLVRAVTLPGSLSGIIYFLKPQWDQLLQPKVWYNAITQMFFSLAICFGTLVMYGSFNNFRKNSYRDVIIITSLDSLTSLLAGCIIFGILGNLAYETNVEDVSKVVKGGAGLAFISYPEAIAKFKYLPKTFAVLFFFMLLVLGIGSNVGMASCVITVIKDRFSHLPHWLLASVTAVVGFTVGLVYTTPGGQFILNLIDFFGCSFIAMFLAIAQMATVAWIYGVKRLCSDIEFMLGKKTSLYWRICWAVVTPGLMFLVLLYNLVYYEPLQYKNTDYPTTIYCIGWLIWAVGVAQLPLWAIYTVYKQPGDTLWQKIREASRPTRTWGPADPKLFEAYVLYRKNLAVETDDSV